MKRIGNSFKGIIGGLIFILFGIGFLWWNEGNNVKNLKTTAQMSKTYIDVSSDKVDSKNEGKLVATNGKLTNEKELADTKFNIVIKTPKLERIVEIYQWKEESETDEDGGTRYSYSKVWSSEIIDSADFHNNGHENPKTKEYDDETFISDEVKVGAFELSSEQIHMLSTNASFSDFDEEYVKNMSLTISGKYITNSVDMNKPQIGDMRISFVYNNSTDVSILAVQKGNSFTDFVSSEGKNINRIMDGVHNGESMINTIKKENNFFKWLFRFIGIFSCIVGFATILKPLSAITSYIPIVGNIVDAAVWLVATILGLCLGLVIIAIAWIRFRPILGIAILLVVGVLLFLLINKNKKNKVNKVEPQPIGEIIEKKSNVEEATSEVEESTEAEVTEEDVSE